MTELLELYFIFFRIGLFSFGGGYTIMPFLRKYIVKDRNWATEEEILNYFAISQCTPGTISVNTATFVGHQQKGALGGIASTLGVITPSLIVISIIANFLKKIKNYPIIQNVFSAVEIVVIAMISNVVINMFNETVEDKIGKILFIISLISVSFLDISPIIVLVVSIFIGVVFYNKKYIKEGDS